MKPTKSLGRYRITYKSGSIQEKDLISHNDYVYHIKPKEEKLKSLKGVALIVESVKIEKEFEQMFGRDWFTDRSPLYFAYSRKVMALLERRTGDHIVKIEKI